MTPDEIEFASRDEITALQLERMRWSLQHAYDNVAHYKDAFDAAGAHPDNLKELSDLAGFPFTTKDDMRRSYPYGLLAVPRDKVARIHASSGTTGRPTIVGYTKADLDVWSRLVARSIRAAGGRAGDMVHVAYGYGLFTGGLGTHYGAERLGCTVVPMSGGNTLRQIQLIEDLAPDIIMVTPSYMLALADKMEQAGFAPAETSLRIGIFGAEPWSEAMRTEIERRVGLDAVDIYGLSELMGPGVANECIETKDGPVLWEDHFYPEIVDPKTGALLPDGETGELVLTTLSKEALPLVRYRTRDLTALLPPTARSMRRLARVSGRSDDMLIIRGVNIFPSQLEALILQDDSLSPHYVVEVDRDGKLDTVTVRTEQRAGTETPVSELVSGLEERIKETLGLTATVDVSAPGTLERSAGKAKRVIDLRKLDKAS
jgi:phenylacetate-CoA ligase